MNLGEVRTHVLEQVDWQPDQSTTFIEKVNRLINRAYQDLCLEAPFLFFETSDSFATQDDVSNVAGLAGDTLAVNSSDARVMERVTPAPGTNDWVFDGQWNGRYLEVTIENPGSNAPGVRRRRILEFWQAGGFDRFTLDQPWPNTTDTGLPYRIFTPEYHVGADVVEIRSARLFAQPRHPMTIHTQGQMERWEYIDFQGEQKGRPYRLHRGHYFQLDAPSLVPSVEANSLWSVAASRPQPDPPGTFQFVYTYAWGARDSEYGDQNGNLLPRWESAPSPISAAITSVAGGGGNGIRIFNLPNIGHVAGLRATTATISDGRSGLRKRIYVRRTAVDPTADGLGYPNVEDTQGVFFFLDEVSATAGELIWLGGPAVPDYYQRLKVSHGYEAIRLWPMPDDRYDVDLRVIRRPNPLVSDSDAPRIHEEAMDSLIHRTLMLFYEVQGNAAMAELSGQHYRDNLKTLGKRYGMISGLRLRKRAARVTRPVREVRVTFTESTT
ncbi:MAG: hypothetical protein ACYTEQ_16925 [Planctomycetota bacterium]